MNCTLRPDILWVGHVDWSVRDFHGYEADRGTTYNAYLVRDTRTALVDTVKADYADELLESVAAALAEPPGPGGDRSPTLDYVVCNHAEPDHSGALPAVMRAYPRAELVCNSMCRAALELHYDTSAWTFRVVKENECLGLGRRSLRFLDTPMVHWPESMWTYVPEERLLFSMDAFGQHLASSWRFDDEADLDLVLAEAKTYYANIIMRYGKPAAAALKKLAPLAIEMLAPSHGVIWRANVPRIVAAYGQWAAGRPRAKVLVLYDSMWQSTQQMAEALLEGASEPGIEALLLPLRRTGLTRLAAEVLDAAAVAVGTPTLNCGPMPAVAAALRYLQGLRPSGKAAVAFGSYGWGGGGAEAADECLRSLGWEVLGPVIKAKYRPTPAVLDECRAAGRRLAAEARRRAQG